MSTSATAKLTEYARELLSFELAHAAAKNSPAFRVCEKLREPLGRLMGVSGFRSLLSRALALAGAEISWLHSLQVGTGGSLEGLETLATTLDSRSVAEGEVVLVSQLLGLLVTFIGPALTARLLHDIWPKVDELNLEKLYEEK